MRILIVEDDDFIAMELGLIVAEVLNAEAAVCSSVKSADGLLDERWDRALLDVDLRDGKSFPVAMRLSLHGVPFIFVGGSRKGQLPNGLAHAAFVEKPYGPANIGHLLVESMLKVAPR